MRQKTITLYTAKELKEKFPKAFEKALEEYRHDLGDFCPWIDEIMESMKGAFAAAHIVLKDWRIGPNSPPHVRFDMGWNTEDLKGPRAMAWLENNMLADLRIPWTGQKRRELAQYGAYYRPGMIKPCPFTGYCADESFIDALKNSLRDGLTLKEAFQDLADVASHLMEAEYEAQGSEEAFLDAADANNWEYDESGSVA